MIADAHVHIVPAAVRRQQVPRHAAVEIDRGRGWLWVEALGPPRLWALALRTATDAFSESFNSAVKDGEYDLAAALAPTRQALEGRGSQFLGANPLNVAMAAFHLSPEGMKTLTTGNGRVYVHQRGRPVRISKRGKDDRGVLRGRSVSNDHPIRPGALILAGSDGAFSEEAVDKTARTLDYDPRIQCAALTSVATAAGSIFSSKSTPPGPASPA